MSSISVIIPTYNAAGYITQAIESVLKQAYRRWEIIVVDDGSTDRTPTLIEPYVQKGLIRYIQQKNNGPSTARNTGIAAARGDYITFLDADDLLAPEYLRSAALFLDDYPIVDFLFSNYTVFDETGVVIGSGVDKWQIFRTIPHVTVGKNRWIFTEFLAKYIIRYGGFMTTSSVTVRKAAIDPIGFREGFFYGEDDDFYARMNYRCRAGYIDTVLVRTRSHGQSLTHDRDNLLRNIAHFIQLSEIQKAYFRSDREIERALNRKIPRLVFDYCWQLIDAKHFGRAHEVLLKYIKQHKTALPLYRLLVKNYLFKLFK